VLDLSGRKPFAAGPFSGEVMSTVSARLWPLFEEDDSGSDSVPDHSNPHTRPIRLLTLEFDYGIKSMAGSLVTSFSGSAEPFCRPFDSCGVQGTSTYSTGTKGGTVEIGGWRVLGRHERPTRRSAMRELRRGLLGVDGDSMLAEGAQAKVASSVHYPDGTFCTDTGGSVDLATLTGTHARKAARLVLGPPNFDRADSLRDDCQGPSEDDVFTSKTPLATGSVPVTALGAKSLQTKLVAAGSFRAGAYTGSRSGEIDLQLALKRVRFRVVRLRVTGRVFDE
jgi:hypothetical protein